jgi:hypothetical protein
LSRESIPSFLSSGEDKYAWSLLQPRQDAELSLWERLSNFFGFLALKWSRDFIYSQDAEMKIFDIMTQEVTNHVSAPGVANDSRNVVKEAIELSELLIANPKQELEVCNYHL